MRRVLSLDGAWRIAYFEDGEGEGRGAFREGYPAKDWLAAEVPGDVHLDLTRAGRASDPFFGKNSEGVRWVEEKEWWYRREFEVPDDFRGDREELVFEGLDCYATVWLNGEEIGKHANALIPCSFDVTGKIRRGQRNVIAVRLSSPVRTVAGRRDPNVPEGLPHRERVFSRKAQVSYGWDFAPRLVTIGIWRGVTLRAYSGVVIEDVFIRPRTVRKDEAWVDLEVRLRSYLRVAREVTVDVVAGCGESRARRLLSLVVKPGANALSLGLRLANAKLWWPWNVGSPNLYDLRLRVLSGEEVLDEYQTRFGVREVKLILKEDGGNVFNFIINGKRV
ncbi:TPA: hypothetical protein EYP44_02075, partial [Candidatus Bathyarchaeota archaeon]|nr:hypothetical protein [Candidatus Bathyarchaeota archaeon]